MFTSARELSFITGVSFVWDTPRTISSSISEADSPKPVLRHLQDDSGSLLKDALQPHGRNCCVDYYERLLAIKILREYFLL